MRRPKMILALAIFVSLLTLGMVSWCPWVSEATGASMGYAFLTDPPCDDCRADWWRIGAEFLVMGVGCTGVLLAVRSNPRSR